MVLAPEGILSLLPQTGEPKANPTTSTAPSTILIQGGDVSISCHFVTDFAFQSFPPGAYSVLSAHGIFGSADLVDVY